MVLGVRKLCSPYPTASLSALTSAQWLRSLKPIQDLQGRKCGKNKAVLGVNFRPQNNIQIWVQVPSPHHTNPPETTI